jgi:hypothetical protein
MTSPVAIGGIGGSGTRLIAEIVSRLGYYIGDDLNVASDNLWFTLLFKRVELLRADGREFDRAVEAFRAAMIGRRSLTPDQLAWVRELATTDRPQHDRGWLLQRAHSLAIAAARDRRQETRWGWKEPNTHVFLDRLAAAFPGLTYVHVVRNGLDMAYSGNQNQLRLWATPLFGQIPADSGPRASLEYWCAVQRRALRLGQELEERFLMLNYDAFCQAPAEHLGPLGRVLGITIDPQLWTGLLSLVRVPESIGRFKSHGLEPFDPADVEYVKELGFDTNPDPTTRS